MKRKKRKERFIIHNDDTACFGIFKSAHSYTLLKEIGYFYNREIINSTSKTNFIPENINGRFHSIFSTMDYYFEQSENNTYEKVKGGYGFFETRIILRYGDKIEFLTKDFNYIIYVLNKYINSPFFNSTQIDLLKAFRNKIIIQKYTIEKNLNQT